LLGNIDTVAIVKNGSVEQVRQALAQCHADAGPAWIAGAGCEIPRFTPRGNVRCFAGI
jgi:uroporphyrinogen-III decarboxylase